MDNKSYYRKQLNRLISSEEYPPSIEIRGGESGKTNSLNISMEQFEQIKDIILKDTNNTCNLI